MEAAQQSIPGETGPGSCLPSSSSTAPTKDVLAPANWSSRATTPDPDQVRRGARLHDLGCDCKRAPSAATRKIARIVARAVATSILRANRVTPAVTTTTTMMTMITDKLIRRSTRTGQSTSTEGSNDRNIRRLFWIEAGLAAISGLLALITPVFPDWIEFVSGWY